MQHCFAFDKHASKWLEVVLYTQIAFSTDNVHCMHWNKFLHEKLTLTPLKDPKNQRLKVLLH